MDPSKLLNDMGANQTPPPSKNPANNPAFFDVPKQSKRKTIIIIVSLVLLVLAIIFMFYIIRDTDYSQSYTNWIIIISGIVAVAGVLII